MPAADLTVTSLIAGTHKLPPFPVPARDLPDGATCALTGESITLGYSLGDVTTDATNEFLDTFRGLGGGFVSESVARCFKAHPKNGCQILAFLAFEDGTLFQPLIARESAGSTGRPCWSDLVRDVWPARQGQRMAAILTTDTKKRLWPRARVGCLGPSTPIYLHDGDTHVSAPLRVDWPHLISVLDLVEDVYSLGFSKRTIRASLLQDYARARQVGFGACRALEARLHVHRGSPEFAVALLIAQRRPGTAQAPSPLTNQEKTREPVA